VRNIRLKVVHEVLTINFSLIRSSNVELGWFHRNLHSAKWVVLQPSHALLAEHSSVHDKWT